MKDLEAFPSLDQEMTLWTPWLHLGDLTTREDCSVVRLSAKNFFDCMRRWWNLFEMAQAYARDSSLPFLLGPSLGRGVLKCGRKWYS